MSARALQRWLCRLALGIAPADMRDWAEAMTREIDEIDDPRAALEWSGACLMSCAIQRFRAVLRILAAAARFALGGYCLVVCGQIAIQSATLIGEGQTTPGKTAFWLFIAMLFGLTAPLIALRRPAAAWTLSAATAVMAANFFAGVSGASAVAISREILAAYGMFGAMLGLTGAAFWLTRRPDADLTV